MKIAIDTMDDINAKFDEFIPKQTFEETVQQLIHQVSDPNLFSKRMQYYSDNKSERVKCILFYKTILIRMWFHFITYYMPTKQSEQE